MQNESTIFAAAQFEFAVGNGFSFVRGLQRVDIHVQYFFRFSYNCKGGEQMGVQSINYAENSSLLKYQLHKR